jgi:DNA-directed RNA polymerase subunit L
MNENQTERLVNAFEQIAEALTRRATLDAARFEIEHPPRREPKDVTITKPKDDEDRLREAQGSTDEDLDEWTGRREKELSNQGS